MSFSRRLAEQLAQPRGPAGRLLGGLMDLANRKPLRLALDLLAPAAGERILDAGCGTGAAMAAMLARAPCRPVGLDLSTTMLRRAERRLGSRAHYELAAIAQMSFGPQSFDAVLALNVLYFADDQGAMVRILREALKPGGRLVGFVTHRDSMKHWGFARQGLHRLYDADQLTAMMVLAGFAAHRVTVQEVRVTRSICGLIVHAIRE